MQVAKTFQTGFSAAVARGVQLARGYEQSFLRAKHMALAAGDQSIPMTSTGVAGDYYSRVYEKVHDCVCCCLFVCLFVCLCCITE